MACHERPVTPARLDRHDGRTPSRSPSPTPKGWHRDSTPFEALLERNSTPPTGPQRLIFRDEASPTVTQDTSTAVAAPVASPAEALPEVPIAPEEAVESPKQLSWGDLVMLVQMHVLLIVLAWDLVNILCVVIMHLLALADDEQQCQLQSSVSDVSHNTLLGVSVGSWASTFDCMFLGCKPVVSTITWFVFLTLSSSFSTLHENESAVDDFYSHKDPEPPSFSWLALVWFPGSGPLDHKDGFF